MNAIYVEQAEKGRTYVVGGVKVHYVGESYGAYVFRPLGAKDDSEDIVMYPGEIVEVVE